MAASISTVGTVNRIPLSLHSSSSGASVPSSAFLGSNLKKVNSGLVQPRASNGGFKVVAEVDEDKQTNKDKWKGLAYDTSDDQQDITRGKGMVDSLFQAPMDTGTHFAVMSSYEYLSTGLRQYSLDNMKDGFYIAPAFMDKLIVHITKNFMTLPNIKVPLILGIWGGKGQGKSFQCELVFAKMGINPIMMSAGELESGNAGEPAKLIRQRYREASDIIRKGKMCCLFINDLDAGAGCSRKHQEIMFSKGAPESIISRCTNILCNDDGSVLPLTAEIRAELETRFNSFAGKETLRCLALALKRMPMGQQTLSIEDETDLTFIGLVGMLDPPRKEVRDAMLSCMAAGIRVIVVTGDNKSTAESLCRQIGAFDHFEDFSGRSYTASEFEELPPLQQSLALQRMVLFTRVEPSHKRMLVEALQRQNEVVAMTGDGVNDAPALKKADIGIAMGSGTAVAKSASDMVLADDNFASIVAAVAEGRAIYNNTKQFIRYMISSNIGEVVCIFVAAVLGMPETLVPVQLLWVNLVTDGLPATAIGFNKQDSDVMMVKPRKVNEAVVSGWLFFRYLVIGAYVGLATIAGYIWWFVYSDSGPRVPYYDLVNFDTCSTRETAYPCSIFDDRHPSTVSMTVLVVVEMFNALNNLSENQSLLIIPPWSNLWLVASIVITMLLHILILYVEPLSVLFSVTPLSWAEWAVVLYLSFPVIIIDEILKFFSRNSRGLRFNFRFGRTDLLPKREVRDK